MKYKLHKKNGVCCNGKGYITIDGHTMFQQDIVRDLNSVEPLRDQRNEALQSVLKLQKENEALQAKIERLESKNEHYRELNLTNEDSLKAFSERSFNQMEINAEMQERALKAEKRWEELKKYTGGKFRGEVAWEVCRMMDKLEDGS